MPHVHKATDGNEKPQWDYLLMNELDIHEIESLAGASMRSQWIIGLVELRSYH